MILKRQLQASLAMAGDVEAMKRLRWRGIGRSLLFAVLALMLAVGTFYWLERNQRNHLRSMLLRQQLWQIRNAVIAYSTNNSALPPDLKSLAEATFVDPSTGNIIPMMENIGRDSEGRLVDTFGNPFNYDPSTGRVSSITPCCRDW